MEITRRDVFKKLAGGGAAAVAAGTSLVTLSGMVQAEETPEAPKEAVGLLYDATRCVGCQSCVYACAEANRASLDKSKPRDPLYLAAHDLNSFTKNVIKLYKPADSKDYSFVKQQCMHCVDPACVAGCSFFALQKDKKTGLVSWTGNKCMGCRYCEISCPFHVPKFQWEGMNPKIVKCELCKERLADGLQPACTSVCPVHAVVFGKRSALLAEAKKRIHDNPGKYYQDRVYGETDAGGTQCLYLSHVPFDKLGLPELGTESVPQKYLKWQKRLYSYLVFPVALYASITAVVNRNWKEHQQHLDEEQKKTGLRPQL
jgi:Fe-S-cluster-containing dehydrogenase component